MSILGLIIVGTLTGIIIYIIIDIINISLGYNFLIRFYYRHIYPFLLEHFTSFNKYSPKIPKGWRQIRLGEKVSNSYTPIYFHRENWILNQYWVYLDSSMNIKNEKSLKNEYIFIIPKHRPPRYKIF